MIYKYILLLCLLIVGCKENISGTVTNKYTLVGRNILGGVVSVKKYVEIEDSKGIRHTLLLNDKDFRTTDIGDHINYYGPVWTESH